MINSVIDEHIKVIESIRPFNEQIEKAAKIIIKAFKTGHKLLIMGNGGSAADSQHIAAELVGRFKLEKAPLPAIALTTDTSTLTSVSNDYAAEQVFSKQIEALANNGDVVLGISTSGNSSNVVQAIEKAKEKKCVTLGLLGKDGGILGKKLDLAITVPSANTARVQETHQLIYHTICEIVEKEFV